MTASHLFSPLPLRGATLRNRIGVSPMCQYSSINGFASDWHMTHIGARATGGAGLIIMEATAVVPEGRITPACLGLWQDTHIEKLSAVTTFAKKQGAVIGIQLAHAGRKASMDVPWKGGAQLSAPQGGWQTVAPSPLPFMPGQITPREMTLTDIDATVDAFTAAAQRAVRAGFQLIEIHAAHGYLLHEFLSPLSNKRTDEYGRTLQNRQRLLLRIAEKLRASIPDTIILATRLSCVDWTEDGLSLEDTIATAAALKKLGVDLIDCSSGFVTPDAKAPFAPGFQVPFATAIRDKASVMTAAVGMISDAAQADAIIRAGQADIVLLGRAMLNDPNWALHAAQTLQQQGPVPLQYLRGF